MLLCVTVLVLPIYSHLCLFDCSNVICCYRLLIRFIELIVVIYIPSSVVVRWLFTLLFCHWFDLIYVVPRWWLRFTLSRWFDWLLWFPYARSCHILHRCSDYPVYVILRYARCSPFVPLRLFTLFVVVVVITVALLVPWLIVPVLFDSYSSWFVDLFALHFILQLRFYDSISFLLRPPTVLILTPLRARLV